MTEQTSRLAIVLDSSGAKKNADSLATALDKMARAAEGAERAADGVSDASKDTSDSTKKLAESVEESHRRIAEFRKRLNETGSVAKASASSQDGLTESYFRQIAGIKDLSRNSQALRDVQAILRIDRKEGNITQQDYLALISETARREKVLGAVEDQRAKKQAAFIQSLKGQVAAQSLSREELLRAKAAQLGVGSAADVYIKKLTGAGKTTERFSLQTAAARRELGIMLAELARGNVGALRNSSITLANRSGLLDQLMSPKMLAATGLVGGLTTAVLGLGVAYYKGSQEQTEFYKSLTLTGNQIGKTTGQLADMAARVATATDGTTGAAAATLNKLVSTGKVAANSLERVTTAIVKTSDATGISTDKLVDDFNKIAENPVQAIGELNDKYHFLTLATYNQIKALQDEGNQQEAARVATDAYSSSLIQRSNDIKANLGLLEGAWDLLGQAAKGAWDAMLDVGREGTVQQKIADTQRQIDEIEKNIRPGVFGMGGIGDGGAQKQRLALLKQQLSALNSEAMAQDVLNDAINKGNQIQQKGIDAQIKINARADRLASNRTKRAKELAELEREIADARAAGAVITAEDEAKYRKDINDRYKDPAAPKTPKGKAYTEDAATRLLDQINQQTAAMQSQLDASDKLNSATQARVKFEQQIADLKAKTQLTADQKSILARSQEILQAYKNQEALQNSVKTLDDYRKMQEEIAPKELRQNETLQKRLEILREMVDLKKLSPEDAGRQASDLISNSVLPNSVISGVNAAGGTLTSGATNSDLSGQGLNMIGLQINPQLEVIEKLKQAQMDYATWLNQQQQLITQDTLLNEQQKQQQLLALQQQGQQNQQALSTATYVAQAQSAQNSFSTITDSMGTMFGEQSSMYKAAFVTQKAFAIAQAALQMPMAMQKALSGLPFPANLAAMATVAGLMGSLTSSITSASLTGMAHNGIDSVPSTGTWLLEKGERVMTAQTSARLDSTLENLRKNGLDATLSKPGYGTGVSNVSNNNQSTTVHAPINQEFNLQGVTPEQLNVVMSQNNKQIVKQIEGSMASDAKKPQSAFGRALNANYQRKGPR